MMMMMTMLGQLRRRIWNLLRHMLRGNNDLALLNNHYSGHRKTTEEDGKQETQGKNLEEEM